MNFLATTTKTILALLVLVVLASCGGKRADQSAEADVEPLLCVALLPTVAHSNDTEETSVSLGSTFSGLNTGDGAYGEARTGRGGDDEYGEAAAGRGDLVAGAGYLYERLQTDLQKLEVTELIEVSELGDQISEVIGGKLGAVKDIGRKARCGAVLVSTMSKFRQRQGGALAVDLPASAAFELQLLEAHSGKTLWFSSFNETQASLMSNLFSFGKAQRRGFKWITVEELVAQGVSEKVEECPYFR